MSVEGKRHIPFRDAKITRILQEYLLSSNVYFTICLLPLPHIGNIQYLRMAKSISQIKPRGKNYMDNMEEKLYLYEYLQWMRSKTSALDPAEPLNVTAIQREFINTVTTVFKIQLMHQYNKIADSVVQF